MDIRSPMTPVKAATAERRSGVCCLILLDVYVCALVTSVARDILRDPGLSWRGWRPQLAVDACRQHRDSLRIQQTALPSEMSVLSRNASYSRTHANSLCVLAFASPSMVTFVSKQLRS